MLTQAVSLLLDIDYHTFFKIRMIEDFIQFTWVDFLTFSVLLYPSVPISHQPTTFRSWRSLVFKCQQNPTSEYLWLWMGETFLLQSCHSQFGSDQSISSRFSSKYGEFLQCLYKSLPSLNLDVNKLETRCGELQKKPRGNIANPLQITAILKHVVYGLFEGAWELKRPFMCTLRGQNQNVHHTWKYISYKSSGQRVKEWK